MPTRIDLFVDRRAFSAALNRPAELRRRFPVKRFNGEKKRSAAAHCPLLLL